MDRLSICSSCVIHITITWIYGISRVRSAVRSAGSPSALLGNFFFKLGITGKLFNQICSYQLCLEAPLTSTILNHFHCPWPCLGVTRSAQSKTSRLYVLPQFATVQDEIGCIHMQLCPFLKYRLSCTECHIWEPFGTYIF